LYKEEKKQLRSLFFDLRKGCIFYLHFDELLFESSVFFEEAPGFSPFVGEETSEDEETDAEEGGKNRQGDVNLLAI